VTCLKTLSQGSPGDEGSHEVPQNRRYSGREWRRIDFKVRCTFSYHVLDPLRGYGAELVLEFCVF
jgi:hypothetical protein